MRKKQKNNTTGYPGVHRTYDRTNTWNTVYKRIRGFIQINKVKYYENFYVHKYINEKAAILSAAMWRENKKGEVLRAQR